MMATETVSDRGPDAVTPNEDDGVAIIDDFYWTYQEEPHRTRRKKILRAHPEITKLNGPEPLTKFIAFGVVASQLLIAYSFRNCNSIWNWKLWMIAYWYGAFANQNIYLCIHELSHNLAFKSPLANRLFSIFVNIPIGIPYSASFRPYHLLHHKYQGDTEFDTDLPTRIEAIVLSSVAGKAFFATFQIFFYAFRPMCVTNIPLGGIHLLNVVFQLVVDAIIVNSWGWWPLIYLLMSSFLAGSLHPTAGHFISEHYLLNPPKIHSIKGVAPPETFSYYGILNLTTWNVGYHNEHHDFPYIPWSRLPAVRQIAPEFYDPLPSHSSWSKVLWDFVLDDNVSLWCRVRRDGKNKSKKLASQDVGE